MWHAPTLAEPPRTDNGRHAAGDCGVLARQSPCDLGPEQPLNIAAHAWASWRTHRFPARHRRTLTLRSSHSPPPYSGVLLRPIESAQYTSISLGQKLEEAGIAPSMGSVADPYDNALAESFVSSLKRELVDRRSWPTRGEVRTAMFEYFEVFYNRQRIHSALGYQSPADYEEGRMKVGDAA